MEFEKSISVIMIVAFLIVIFVEFIIGHNFHDDED
jgi:phosphate/sulfate permease